MDNDSFANGEAKFNITGLSEGVYIVNATVNDEAYVPKVAFDVFTVSKANSTIKVDVENLYVGDTAYINVTVPDDNAGTVTIEINGKVYGPESVTDGVARFVVPDVTYGNKTVAVTYSGTDKYVVNFTTANFTVDKRTPVMNITDDTIKYLENATFTIKTNVPGYYTLFIKEDEVGIYKVDDELTVTVPTDLVPGTYDVTIAIDETENHTAGK